jgi:hypothetical protein
MLSHLEAQQGTVKAALAGTRSKSIKLENHDSGAPSSPPPIKLSQLL